LCSSVFNHDFSPFCFFILFLYLYTLYVHKIFDNKQRKY
jgi:hypothetical protein